MQLKTAFLSFALSLLAVPSTLASQCSCRDDITTKVYHQHILNNYLAVWGGKFSLINTTFHPDMVVFSDRFPSSTGNGSTLTRVTNRDEFTAFVKKSRNGWKEYSFTPIQFVANDDAMAVRWKMNGILGANFTLFPTPLKAGAAVTYNGTDFLVLDDCTGQIREAYIAQDLISYFHAMGLTEITV
ncbi:hypothetical protein N7462_001424 [Penicillium macrosclerotiorum]|uniref:uncharacterized protein n=1 Tax=Penicillium macrosclerotiorum TaxID=303699 RepID=UPI0025496984|nr:uncharacterized protein N7462_001424 [Penicillium macrosclerotiorum]KAJ5692001.1 hypothetical protein N7462_001424 [Penicillium macrosclerotiorum]